MKIYFVRHGHPDYQNDCLTELGIKHAQAAAERLKGCKLERIFSSSNGRAMETAAYTAEQFGLEVVPCDFMREIGWKSIDGTPILANGHPWHVSDFLVEEGRSLSDEAWQESEPYCKSFVVDRVNKVTAGFDALLATFGYQREGEYYRVTNEDVNKNIAVFSHGGSSSAVLSHLLNIPFPQFCGALRLSFTSICVVQLPNNVGKLIYPRLLLFNDARHIEGLAVENVFGN